MNYYQVLGIPESASDKEIKKAYKKLVKKYHPDIFHGDKEFAENKIKEINEAYDTLSVPDLKAEYDDALHGVSDASSEVSSYSSQSQSDYANNRVRDNDFYNSDSYRHYSYNYYGRPRTSSEFEEYKKSQAQKTSITDEFFFGNRNKLVLTVGLIAIILIILLIGLLSTLKNLTSTSTFEDIAPAAKEKENVLYIEKGLPYEVVVQYLGEPTSKKYSNTGFTIYYNSSYIVFDKSNRVIDWFNNGDFYSDFQSGSREDVYQELYNQIQNAMNFEY